MVMLFLVYGRPLYAETDSHSVVPFMGFFESVSRELEVPASVAMAIAKVESGLKPWTLNIEGQSFRFQSKDEAISKAMEAQRSGCSFDVGIMQINRWWLDRYDISLDAAFDPLANIYIGGWILKGELTRHKNLRAAIGAYHSPDPFRANLYAAQVMKALENGSVKPTPKRSRAKNGTQPSVATDTGRAFPAGPQSLKISYDFDKSMKVSKSK
jgi:hypothetical protein